MAGYRGYISSRKFFGERAPQHVQNIIIRDYCKRNDMQFLLSSTEYAMEDCFIMLENLINDSSEIDGIVCYSLFQLPQVQTIRQQAFENIFDRGRSIHFAVEALSAERLCEVERLEDIFLVKQSIGKTLSCEELNQVLWPDYESDKTPR